MSDGTPNDEKQAVLLDGEKAWLTAFFSSPAGHRQAAQGAYTVAAAVAAAIVAAGALSDIVSAWRWLQVAAGVVLALWLLVAWMFMHAAGTQPKFIKRSAKPSGAGAADAARPGQLSLFDTRTRAQREREKDEATYGWTRWQMLAQALRKKRKEAMPKPDPRTDPPAEFVGKALDRTWAERDSIARWSGVARKWAAIAIVATGAALAFAFVADYQGWGAEHEVKGVVALSRGGAAAIWAVCDPGKLKKPRSKMKEKQPPVGAKLRQTDVAYERDANATVRSTSTITSVPTTGVYAWMRPSTLDDAIVKVRFDKKECQPDEETVRLRKSQIKAFETP